MLHALNILIWSVAASTALAFDRPDWWVVGCLGVAGSFGVHASIVGDVR